MQRVLIMSEDVDNPFRPIFHNNRIQKLTVVSMIVILKISFGSMSTSEPLDFRL